MRVHSPGESAALGDVDAHSDARAGKDGPPAVVHHARGCRECERLALPFNVEQLLLNLEAEADGGLDAVERDLERVALRVDLVAGVEGEVLADHGVVDFLHLRVNLGVGGRHGGGLLDVGEDEDELVELQDGGGRGARAVLHQVGRRVGEVDAHAARCRGADQVGDHLAQQPPKLLGLVARRLLLLLAPLASSPDTDEAKHDDTEDEEQREAHAEEEGNQHSLVRAGRADLDGGGVPVEGLVGFVVGAHDEEVLATRLEVKLAGGAAAGVAAENVGATVRNHDMTLPKLVLLHDSDGIAVHARLGLQERKPAGVEAAGVVLLRGAKIAVGVSKNGVSTVGAEA
mmetsp:Transcript_30365/g.54351  ORF Transcript_30365/g.54351 Transcript_30365/m.54351 type:complete len:343 (+) Transcript_30365:2970-3998(+)